LSFLAFWAWRLEFLLRLVDRLIFVLIYGRLVVIVNDMHLYVVNLEAPGKVPHRRGPPRGKSPQLIRRKLRRRRHEFGVVKLLKVLPHGRNRGRPWREHHTRSYGGFVVRGRVVISCSRCAAHQAP